MPAFLSSGKTGSTVEIKHHPQSSGNEDSFLLPAYRPIPGAELEAEFSVASCAPSMFSLFSTCFFSVRVLEGSIGSRGRYGTTDEEAAALPSSSATSVRTRGPIKNHFVTQKRFSSQKRYTTEKKTGEKSTQICNGITEYGLFYAGLLWSNTEHSLMHDVICGGGFLSGCIVQMCDSNKMNLSLFYGYLGCFQFGATVTRPLGTPGYMSFASESYVYVCWVHP